MVARRYKPAEPRPVWHYRWHVVRGGEHALRQCAVHMPGTPAPVYVDGLPALMKSYSRSVKSMSVPSCVGIGDRLAADWSSQSLLRSSTQRPMAAEYWHASDSVALPMPSSALVMVNSYQASDGMRYATAITAAHQTFLPAVRR